MNNIYILCKIAQQDKLIWKLFSMLNHECYEYFNVWGREYEIAFRKIIVDGYRIMYELDGIAHRSDGPAVIYHNGNEYWYFNGEFYNGMGSVVTHNNVNYWHYEGKLHRIYGPAVEYCKKQHKKYFEYISSLLNYNKK